MEQAFGAQTRLCMFSHCGNLAMPDCNACFCSTCYALIAQVPGDLAAYHHPHCGNRHAVAAAPAPRLAPHGTPAATPPATGGSGCRTPATPMPAAPPPMSDFKAQLAAAASGGELQLATLHTLAREHGASADFWAAALEAGGGNLATTHHCLQSTCPSSLAAGCAAWCGSVVAEYGGAVPSSGSAAAVKYHGAICRLSRAAGMAAGWGSVWLVSFVGAEFAAGTQAAVFAGLATDGRSLKVAGKVVCSRHVPPAVVLVWSCSAAPRPGPSRCPRGTQT